MHEGERQKNSPQSACSIGIKTVIYSPELEEISEELQIQRSAISFSERPVYLTILANTVLSVNACLKIVSLSNGANIGNASSSFYFLLHEVS